MVSVGIVAALLILMAFCCLIGAVISVEESENAYAVAFFLLTVVLAVCGVAVTQIDYPTVIEFGQKCLAEKV